MERGKEEGEVDFDRCQPCCCLAASGSYWDKPLNTFDFHTEATHMTATHSSRFGMVTVSSYVREWNRTE